MSQSEDVSTSSSGSLNLLCPCGFSKRLPSKFDGKKVVCPKCRRVLSVTRVKRATLDQRVNEVPWIGTHVAWHEIAGTTRFDWGQETDAATADFVRTLTIGCCTKLCAFYGTSYPVFAFDASWLGPPPTPFSIRFVV